MTAAATPPNPYPGLRAFEPDESSCFFGRERETDDLRRRLRVNRFLAVVGASGSGKSSLVRCGLVPSLHAGFMSGAGSRWRVAIFRPGQDPIGNLAAALSAPGVLGNDGSVGHAGNDMPPQGLPLEVGLRDSSRGLAAAVRQAALPAGDNLLLVVDQFEELFRFRRRSGPDTDDEATAFVKLLIEAAHASGGRDTAGTTGATPIYVVLTMRSEFIGECMAFHGLPEAINAGQYLVPGLTRDALRAAITGPAAVQSVVVAPRLLVRLLNEVSELGDTSGGSDQLPVLQHALMRTWDAWAGDHAHGEPLDVRHYEAIGTLSNALSMHADEAWAGLAGPREQGIAEKLFKALTVTNDDGLGLRRPTAFGLLVDACAAQPAELARVIDVFRAPGRAFVQPPAGVVLGADDVVDISHESLMRLWTRLVVWVQEEARATEVYRRLQRSARQHADGEASLWRPPELTLGQRWRRENPLAGRLCDPAEFEQALRFLARSESAHRLRVATTALAVASAVGLAIGWFVVDAHRQQGIAEARRVENLALQAEVARLTQAKAQASAAQQQQQVEVQALRAAHVDLKGAVARFEADRVGQGQAIVKLREGNTTLESQFEVLATEHLLLEARSDALDRDFTRAQAAYTDLSWRLMAIGPVPPTLRVQEQALQQAVEALRVQAAGLSRQVRETEPCAVPVMAMAPPAPAPPFPLEPARKRGAAQAPLAIPADPGSSDSLLRRIEALARELAALIDERARLQDEAAWLRQANALLEQQRAALAQEVERLHGVKRGLALRQEALRENLRLAQAERQSLLDFITNQEARNTQLQARIDDLSARHNSLEREAVGVAGAIGRLNASATELRSDIRTMVERLTPIVGSILQHASATAMASDLAAMLAVKAYRWAPYDTDDAAQPVVYNGLWLALRRIDAKAAAELLAPGDPAAGKLATTRSEVMVKALCARAGRPLTESEWLRYMPAGACFTPQAAKACGP